MPRFFTFLLSCASLLAADLWVDNVNGDDANDGSEAAPFRTPQAAVEVMKGGDTLHLRPTGVPYPGPISIDRRDLVGTPDRPTVVEGHGAVLTGRRRTGADEWTAEPGDNVWRMPLPNNAHVMDGFWRGDFPICWIDDRPATNAESLDALPPGGAFLYKNRKGTRTDPLHNTLYVKLPAGDTPATTSIETLTRAAILVGTSHTVVRNVIVEDSSHDGFDTFHCSNVLFENVEARRCMDNGISHHGTQVTVRNGWFHNNAGCGIVDVDESHIRYENCLIEDDSYRGQVILLTGTFEMVDCVVRGNVSHGIAVNREATVSLTNCLIDGRGGDIPGVSAGPGSRVTMRNCTVYDCGIAVTANLKAGGWLDVENCALLRCPRLYRVIRVDQLKDEDFAIRERLRGIGNVLTPGEVLFDHRRRPQPDKPWKVTVSKYSAENWAELPEALNLGNNSVWIEEPPETAPLSLPDCGVGASIDPAMAVGANQAYRPFAND